MCIRDRLRSDTVKCLWKKNVTNERVEKITWKRILTRRGGPYFILIWILLTFCGIHFSVKKPTTVKYVHMLFQCLLQRQLQIFNVSKAFFPFFPPEHIVISMQDLSVVNVCSKIELHNGIVSIINGQWINNDITSRVVKQMCQTRKQSTLKLRNFTGK